MLNGRYDYTFPVDSSQKPFFRWLGTAEKDKRHVLYDAAHDVMVNRTEVEERGEKPGPTFRLTPPKGSKAIGLLADPVAGDIHGLDRPGIADVGKGIPLQDDQIGPLAGLEGPEILGMQKLGGAPRCRHDGLHRGQAGVHHA
jgi:hypothetical protein